MDRREAIKILKEANVIDLASGDTMGRQAVDLAIEALEKLQLSQETSTNEVDTSTNTPTNTPTDLISRQAAIEALCDDLQQTQRTEESEEDAKMV